MKKQPEVTPIDVEKFNMPVLAKITLTNTTNEPIIFELFDKRNGLDFYKAKDESKHAFNKVEIQIDKYKQSYADFFESIFYESIIIGNLKISNLEIIKIYCKDLFRGRWERPYDKDANQNFPINGTHTIIYITVSSNSTEEIEFNITHKEVKSTSMTMPTNADV